MTHTPPLLELHNVCTGYGSIVALRGVSLYVNEGEIVTIVGANGAGKTTTLMTIAGAHRIRSGYIKLCGTTISNVPSYKILAQGLSLVPEGRKIFSRLTVMENLELGAYLRTDKSAIRDDLDKIFALFPILAERSSQAGGTLSGGEQQMLAIGRALMSRPKLLLMDEPSMGIAPLVVQKIFEAITTLNKQGMTILLVEQNANLALKTATRGYVMENGVNVIEGQAKSLLVNPRVKEAYLG